jgi:FKBP-type peptidyl-prolyl cis-trans isomerase FklB
MLRTLSIILLVLFDVLACMAAQEQAQPEESSLMSYSIGYQVGGDFQRMGIKVDPRIVLRGVLDAWQGGQPAMQPEEMHTVLADLQRDVQESLRKKAREGAEENLAAGKAFLAENGRKKDVRTLPSGLQYLILSEGNGESPSPRDFVEVNYRGTLIDGTEFDSTAGRGKPLRLRTDMVIEGWKEALPLMKSGGKWRLFIPPELAYGDKRMGAIEPNSTLIFEVELLSVSRPAGNQKDE